MSAVNFCSNCGEKVSLLIPDGDNRYRYVCNSCHTIHYQNPKIVTGCIPQWQDRVLLCKRAIEPRYGLWTLPAGFLENEETIVQGAMRETAEEANATVENMRLFCVFSIAHINQVYMMYRGDLVGGLASASPNTMARHYAQVQAHCPCPPMPSFDVGIDPGGPGLGGLVDCPSSQTVFLQRATALLDLNLKPTRSQVSLLLPVF